ncbi:MAG: 2-octaprenyl-6-methoxyphenyl hydroxylase [Alphaproteobacteria bacterium]|nr:2-octaprenyl-6-methoxyphenyl hydroxylase [Alphaproteobacteria bacterium]
MTARPPAEDRCDALIVGAGPVGMTLAAALGGAGLRVALVDRADPDAQAALGADGRTTAISAGSRRVLDGVGAWAALTADACPIDAIRVADGGSPLFVHYDAAEVGDDPLGHIVDNFALRGALLARVRALPCVRLLAPAPVTEIVCGPVAATARLADGTALRAAVVLACDGRRSALRTEAGIETVEWSYGQDAIVCTVHHEHPHGNVAVEHFRPDGPFAMLPMTDAPAAAARAAGGLVHRSSIVWTERAAIAPDIAALPRAEFEFELVRRVGDRLGRLAVPGTVWRHPLALTHARHYVDRRLALVGDAAHAIHPIAGQGLNMGFRDAAALAELLVDARRCGLDIGAAGVLAGYERWRRFDNTVLAVVTDAINRLFSNDIAPLRTARRLGFGAVQRIAPARRLFMRHAMGVVGDLPRLARGETL